MKFQFSEHVIFYGYEMSPGQFSSKKRTNYDFFGYVKDWPKETVLSYPKSMDLNFTFLGFFPENF